MPKVITIRLVRYQYEYCYLRTREKCSLSRQEVTCCKYYQRKSPIVTFGCVTPQHLTTGQNGVTTRQRRRHRSHRQRHNSIRARERPRPDIRGNKTSKSDNARTYITGGIRRYRIPKRYTKKHHDGTSTRGEQYTCTSDAGNHTRSVTTNYPILKRRNQEAKDEGTRCIPRRTT